MTTTRKTEETEHSMTVMEAIYKRRAVRDYLPKKVEKSKIMHLLDAAVHAPTAMHEEPWGFVVIQDKDILNSISDTAKDLLRKETENSDSSHSKHTLDLINQPNYNVFYNAGTLIVIYSKFQGPFVGADCWLAAENLMLTALVNDLGSCVIGFSVSVLNLPEWKSKLEIPNSGIAVAPIIIGYPASEKPTVSRKKPDIFCWK